jgi:hypothetical protein
MVLRRQCLGARDETEDWVMVSPEQGADQPRRQTIRVPPTSEKMRRSA